MFSSLLDFQDFFKTERKAVIYFIKMRWNSNVQCPYKECDNNKNKCYTLKSEKDFKCASCGKTFSYKTGTIFENSKISMKKWFLAIYLHTSHKKGISSPQLAKYLKVRQATAWFILHRLRLVGKNFFGKVQFSGTTEIDECYVGGSESNKHTNKKFKSEKSVIVGLVNRETKQVKAFKIDNANKECLLPKIGCNVKEKSTIVTDTYHAYNNLRRNYTHKTVKHSANEYVRNEIDIDGRVAFKVHTNTIEGFWSLVKRTINGTHHWISKKHTQAYLAEMEVRYNTKEQEDCFRFESFVSKVNGLRLKYKDLIAVV
jgi:transposase-like protein